jgi:broad specificity phosphatase PhoE
MSVGNRVVLVRHGPSAHIHRGALDRDGVRRWRDAYDAAGIVVDCEPPQSVIALAADATHIIASDLPRAIESARRLAPKREIRISELMREAPLPIPRWPTRLPLAGWGAAIYVTWGYDRIRGADRTGEHWARAASAAKWLAELGGTGDTTLVVTHGVFRRLLAEQLLGLGWMATERRGGYRHWSSWSFTGRGAMAAPAAPSGAESLP